LPAGLRIEPAIDNDDSNSNKDVIYDEASNTVRIPLGLLSDDASKRRTKLVMFTCKPCGHRTARMVNPLAWAKGLVFCQCANPECGAWHNLAANNPKLYEEIRYDKEEEGEEEEEVQGSSGDDGSSERSEQTEQL
jgi:hypothetical protein